MAIGALCATVPLAAQTAPAPNATPEQGAPAQTAAPPDNEIVVTGETTKTPDDSEVFDQARDVSRVGRYQLYEEALPRFETPLCPGVVGLKPGAAGSMIDRIRANAARLDIALAEGDCSPNLVVAFVDDGRSLLNDLRRNRPQIFRLVSADERTELLREKAPVRVWNNIATRWTGAGPPPEPGVKPSVWGQLNRLYMPESHDIVSALVLFDREAVLGMTLDQLADYATMRGLSHTRPASADEPMATILSLFEGHGQGPDALTSFDIGYLQSLYRGASNLSAAHKLLGVRRQAANAQDASER
jgi:hypothetical protein